MAASSANNILIPDKNAILEQTFTEAIQSNFNAKQKWTNWKEDHEKLKKTLKDLPNKLSHPGVVPFGTRALVKADIVHTNEILSCVGDGYFVKQSAKQAIDMCDRRIKDSEKMLEDLQKEYNLISNRRSLPKLEEAFPSEDDEIVEEYDEEKEAEWRERHREMEKKYRQELAELRKKREDQGPPQSEEDLFRRLDMLELEEELNDELERLNDGTDSDEADEESDEDEETVSEEEVEKQDSQEKDIRKSNQLSNSSNNEKLTIADKTKINSEGYQKVSKNAPVLEPGSVSYGYTDPEGNEWQKSVQTISDEEEKSAISTLQKSRKSVSFASDEDEPECEVNQEVDPHIFIRFKHSDNEYQEPCGNQFTDHGDKIVINSPKDIYKQYSQFISDPAPKSILKKNSSYEGESSTSESIFRQSQSAGSLIGFDMSDDEDEDDVPEPIRDLSHLPPVLQDVLESNPSEPAVSQPRPVESERPVSRFKASRAASRR